MPIAKPQYTVAEYLDHERRAEQRSEYLDGEIFAMAGASRRHNLICLNFAAALHSRLRDRLCEVYANDMRLEVAPGGLYTYPDILAVCGEPSFVDDQFDTLQNPLLIAEVLSPSTADYDRGAKFEHYRGMSSLQEYLLVAQDEPHVVLYVRRDDGTWLLSETRDLESSVRLSSLEIEVPMSEIYAKVRFGAREFPRSVSS